ncbi:hypothetical protein ACFL04_00290 [Patescibacteria group bacterium]
MSTSVPILVVVGNYWKYHFRGHRVIIPSYGYATEGLLPLEAMFLAVTMLPEYFDNVHDTGQITLADLRGNDQYRIVVIRLANQIHVRRLNRHTVVRH